MKVSKVKVDNKKLLMYDGDKRYTFLNATIWECVKFWNYFLCILLTLSLSRLTHQE